MIYRDDPDYKPLQEKAHALSLEVSQLTLDLDEMSRAYYYQGIPTTQAERSDIQAKRSKAAHELKKVEIAIFNLREKFRISNQKDLLDILICVVNESGHGSLVAKAVEKQCNSGLKNYRQMTNAQAREWLVKNDKEAASFWMEQPEEGLVEWVGDNPRDFGDDTTGGWTAK